MRHQPRRWQAPAGFGGGRVQLVGVLLLLVALLGLLRRLPQRHELRARAAGSAVTHAASSTAPAAPQQPWCPRPGAAGRAAAGGAGGFPMTPFPANLWFVKTVKTGSSTLTSVFNSICQHYGILWMKTDTARWDVRITNPDAGGVSRILSAMRAATDAAHVAVTDHMVYRDDVAAVFGRPFLLFTSVRHPVPRVHSHHFQNMCLFKARELGWDVGLPARAPQPYAPNSCDTNATFLEMAVEKDALEKRWRFARSGYAKNRLYKYVRGDAETVEAAAAKYDFIFVAERMNEGLVLFMLEYGLTYEDIAYLPLKQRTGKYKTAKDMPAALNDFILANNQLDLQLWEIANRRLDEARTGLERRCGAGLVGAALAAFERLLGQVAAECGDYTAWYERHGFASQPVTYTGLPGTAFDSGTGYRCVRHVARRFMLGAPGGGGGGGEPQLQVQAEAAAAAAQGAGHVLRSLPGSAAVVV